MRMRDVKISSPKIVAIRRKKSPYFSYARARNYVISSMQAVTTEV